MVTRRNFTKTVLAAAAAFSQTNEALGAFTTSTMEDQKNQKFRPAEKFGLGGVAIGNGFKINSDEQANQTMAAAWAAGVRYFDTSPWYGLGLSERRFGHFLYNKKREDYVISTKIGRILTPDSKFEMPGGLWKGKLNFSYKYDFSAAGVRRSIEDSLQRMGLPYLDIVFIHDLSPDNGDMKDKWTNYFDEAAKGAMPELTKMREEGIIKAWGFGVNTVDPILKTIEVADPDIFLSATQYSLMLHEDALNRLFPVCEKRDISLVIGAPLNAGFLAGMNRYNYGSTIPSGFLEKRAKMEAIAAKHRVDLRTAALQFSAAPKVVSSVIPGASTAEQAIQNAASMHVVVPAGFWEDLKREKLIAANAPVPVR
jgi:D-threo-aldose 1-dehydrogenase